MYKSKHSQREESSKKGMKTGKQKSGSVWFMERNHKTCIEKSKARNGCTIGGTVKTVTAAMMNLCSTAEGAFHTHCLRGPP